MISSHGSIELVCIPSYSRSFWAESKYKKGIFFSHIPGEFKVNSRPFQANSRSIPGIFQVISRHLPGQFQVNFCFSWGELDMICVLTVTFMYVTTIYYIYKYSKRRSILISSFNFNFFIITFINIIIIIAIIFPPFFFFFSKHIWCDKRA